MFFFLLKLNAILSIGDSHHTCNLFLGFFCILIIKRCRMPPQSQFTPLPLQTCSHWSLQIRCDRKKDRKTTKLLNFLLFVAILCQERNRARRVKRGWSTDLNAVTCFLYCFCVCLLLLNYLFLWLMCEVNYGGRTLLFSWCWLINVCNRKSSKLQNHKVILQKKI